MRVKRLIASFGASFESFISKVENHEAVADSVIADVRAAAAKLRVQRGRIQHQLQRLGAEQKKLQTEQERWRKRALQLGDTEEQRSLQCVRHFKLTKSRLRQVEHQIDEYHSMDERLQSNLTDVEQRLEQLRLKKTALSSRSARASALAGTRGEETLTDMEQVFDRWETAVLEDEYREGVCDESTDSFEREFLAAEELDDLRATLDDIKKAAATDGQKGETRDAN
ncbi:hypothetical protein FKG94_02390 [Exilibacterium tricleocarpae]|uniref:PspA/IM30 family protein n=1 Tax=Exilibacterium tricleocarpae TaxID=2591008 RepID=A0A545U8B9_9GAMM|nr:PspA/IM30 family protein [Exilibacterium tricleocarpae]TQV85711.1 hypothetical protein FKG94_02390 [Exilibacterium tricleocarpae]